MQMAHEWRLCFCMNTALKDLETLAVLISFPIVMCTIPLEAIFTHLSSTLELDSKPLEGFVVTEYH